VSWLGRRPRIGQRRGGVIERIEQLPRHGEPVSKSDRTIQTKRVKPRLGDVQGDCGPRVAADQRPAE